MATVKEFYLATRPVSLPPPGVESNFVNPESKTSSIYISAGICLPLLLAFAALRFWAKASLIHKKRGWGDVTCGIGLVSGIFFIVIATVAVSGGTYGHHEWDISTVAFTKRQLILSLIATSIYGPCIWFIKLAIFMIYLEVFILARWLKLMFVGGMVVTGLFYFATMSVFLGFCSPADGHDQHAYLMAFRSDRCFSTGPLIIAIGVVNIVSDLFLLTIPLLAVWNMQIPPRKKLSVFTLLSLIFSACIASVLGLAYRIYLARGLADKTWLAIPVWITDIVEITAGILVSCLPTIAAAFEDPQNPIRTFINRSKQQRPDTARLESMAAQGQMESTPDFHQIFFGPIGTQNSGIGINDWHLEGGKIVHTTTAPNSIDVERVPREFQF